MTTTVLIDDSRRHDQKDVVSGAELVRGLRLGERQTNDALTVYPLFAEEVHARDDAAEYVTLGEGLSDGDVVITEVSEDGLVPEVRVLSKGDAHILALDGEELLGARQNRILSTTILIEKHSTLVVPVTCVERSRWAYTSTEFVESEIVAERRIRWATKDSTHASLFAGSGHCAAQGRVWMEVERLHRKHGTGSSTDAMRGAYESRKRDLDSVLAAFPLVDGQIGLLVLHGSRVVGLDLVSQAPQYACLHQKLLRSYAFEALLRGGEPGSSVVAEEFLERIATLQGRRFKSPGLGWDVRFEGEGILGSALVHDGQTVHAAFFDVRGATESADDAPGDDRPSWRVSDARDRARRRERRW